MKKVPPPVKAELFSFCQAQKFNFFEKLNF